MREFYEEYGYYVLVVFLGSWISACTSPGAIRLRFGQDQIDEITVTQPSDAKDAAKLSVSKDGAVQVTTPGTHQPTAYTEKATTNGLLIIGGLFAAAAVAGFAFRGYLPLMPSNLPIGCGIASGLCFAAPTVIDKYLLHILVAGGAWLIWSYTSYRHNRKLKDHVPIQDPE